MSDTMQTVQFLGSSRVEVREVPVPEPGPGEALIRLAISAICGSELPAYGGGAGDGRVYNPGHEMGGVIVKANDLCRLREGQRVGLQVFHGCGRCIYCLQGNPEHCAEGTQAVVNAHSEYVVAPEVCLIPLPDDLDWEPGVLLCGDPIGTPYHALKRMGGVHAGQTVALFGFGPIGQGFMALLRYYGVRTIVSELGAYRRELAARLGARLVLDPSQEDVVARIRRETGGGADLCVDCSHGQETFTAALDAARVHGRVGWVGEKRSAVLSPSDQAIRKELQITASWYFTVPDFWEEYELYRRGLSVAGLITHRFALADAPAAYRLFASGETGKVVFRRG
jgi:threonine dehydrogenase-like Zn-dependent dehydrogenase